MDLCPAGQLHRLGQEIERIFQTSLKEQNQRDLAEEENRQTQVCIYGMVSALSQQLESCRPQSAAQDDQMEDTEEGQQQKKVRTQPRSVAAAEAAAANVLNVSSRAVDDSGSGEGGRGRGGVDVGVGIGGLGVSGGGGGGGDAAAMASMARRVAELEALLSDKEIQLCAAEEERRVADAETAALDADVAAMREDCETARRAASDASRQVREAAALGLIEGRDELETRLDQSKPRRVQAFQRFILEQLHKEDANGSASSLPANAKTKSSSGTAEKTETGCVERLFALVSTQTHTCAQCNRVEKRSSRSFQTDLQYPEKKTWRKGSPSNPTFAECLAKSLCASQEVRAWCDGHGAYTRMAQRKVPKRLPQVLSVNLGMRDPGDLRWWGVDVDSHVLSAAAKAPVEKHWLPQYVRVAVDEEAWLER